ncbi:MAG: hypothetical protein LBM61_04600 [Prevotellaceae bacterium]|jgi:hypothetical protein|nr:hypothetical protein [Prevotellaceae bacterium]
MNNGSMIYIVRGLMLAAFIFCPKYAYSQSGEETAQALIELGFENVRWTEDDSERVYVIENNVFKSSGVGVGKAIDQIQQTGLPTDGTKACCLIVLVNNVPRVALRLPAKAASAPTVSRADWQISNNLGDSWEKVKHVKSGNSSLFKPDIVLIPEFWWRNYRISVMYEVYLAFSPSLEISLWPGMKLGYQVVFPIINQYSQQYDKIRPGFVTLSQTFRLPARTFVTATVGTFSNERWGFDVRAKHFLPYERLSVEGRFGYTSNGRYDGWAYKAGTKYWTWTGTLAAEYFWQPYNTTIKVSGNRYLYGEYGIRGDMMRHYRYASIGFYAMLINDPGFSIKPANNGFNGGFTLQIAIPPYRSKRKGYIPHVKGGDFTTRYNAGNEWYYGRNYNARADDNYRNNIDYNPYFLKSELLNY